MIGLWCISLRKFRCCLKFVISLTRWCRTEQREIVPNTNYFKTFILKFKTIVYFSYTKIMLFFAYVREIFSPYGKSTLPLDFFNIGIFRKNVSKYAKPMVELYTCEFKPNLPIFYF